MASYAADTHALVWHLTGDSQLGATAHQILTEADQGLHVISVPAIVLVETVYIGEKQRRGISAEQVAALFRAVTTSASYVVAPLDLAVVLEMQNIPRDLISDMPDRIIVATARVLGLPLITDDREIRESRLVQIVW
ncbi:MAG: type II toxin-antitoxin system VapC family toxin [Candidatus Rokuibacteriota bacterium]